MPQKPKPQIAPAPKPGSTQQAEENMELSTAELDQVSGGKKLPGKPPTLTLK